MNCPLKLTGAHVWAGATLTNMTCFCCDIHTPVHSLVRVRVHNLTNMTCFCNDIHSPVHSLVRVRVHTQVHFSEEGEVEKWTRSKSSRRGKTRKTKTGPQSPNCLNGPRDAGIAELTVKAVKTESSWYGETRPTTDLQRRHLPCEMCKSATVSDATLSTTLSRLLR